MSGRQSDEYGHDKIQKHRASRSPRAQVQQHQRDAKALHSPPGHIPKASRKSLAAPPGSELARARIAAHNAFDPLWQTGRFNRGVCYQWLASELGLPVAACHMVLFDVAMCQRVVALCETHPHARQAAIDLVARDFDDLTKDGQ